MKTFETVQLDAVKKRLFAFVLFVIGCLLFFQPFRNTDSTSSPEISTSTATYFRAKAEKILEETMIPFDGESFYTQTVEFKRNDTQESVIVSVGSEFQPLNASQKIQLGKVMILSEQQINQNEPVSIVVNDVYRTPTIIWLFTIFCVVVILVASWQGWFSIIGMFISLVVLMNGILPLILKGYNPILVTLSGAFIIGAITIYLAHGWSMKSHIALGSIMASLFLVAMLSYTAVLSAQLVGLGSEEAYFLQFGDTANINLQGLLLGGIILGALGVLDDITISQTSIVFQLQATKKKISFSELYSRSLTVGKDHVASLVNTLVLAYAGANLPLFMLFSINSTVPPWVTLNSEIILEEVIRTLTGSIGLVAAVPLTTLIACYVAIKKPEWVSQHVKEFHYH